MISFLVISGVIFLCCVGLAIFIAVGERRYGHASDDD